MAATHERVTAALEMREPDRVPVMDVMEEYANIYEVIGRLPERAYRAYSHIQRDFGDRIFVLASFLYGLFENAWQPFGFDGVHALEPTAGVELAEVKRMAGDRVCLLGNLDITRVLVDASREELEAAVKTTVRDAGAGGGYILAPTKSHPGISLTRLRWTVEAAGKYGKYPLAAD